MTSVSVRVVQDKRDALVFLSLAGFKTLAEAKSGLVAHLNEEGLGGDGGTIETLETHDDAIGIETDRCGLWIYDSDIEQAMAMNGREHAC